jgi:hypothetical protein
MRNEELAEILKLRNGLPRVEEVEINNAVFTLFSTQYQVSCG